MLLERLRLDRHKLIEFIISSNVIKAVDFPTGTSGVEDVDLDAISADYMLECAVNGKVLDLSEAARMHYNEMNLPIMINHESGCSFFLVTKPELSCSPPHHVPPELVVNMGPGAFPCSSNSLRDVVDDTFRSSYYGYGNAQTTLPVQNCEIFGENNLPPIGLPSFVTDLSEDDLRDAAYETLVACLVHSGHLQKLSSTSGSLVQTTESKIKERKTRFASRQRKKENEETSLQSQSASASSEVIDVICTQMEISQVIDRCARQGLSHSSLIAEAGKLHVPKISIELLKNVSQSGFPNKKAYIRWIKRQTRILEEVLCSHSLSGAENELKSILADMRNEKVWAMHNASSQVAGIFSALQRSVMEFSETHKEFGTRGGSHYWETGYHVNLRLYEKLLCSTFDSLDGQQVEETEEILGLLKATWPALGVTKMIHTALYCWVLFRQFASIGEPAILELAWVELKKVQTFICDDIEDPYLSSLNCTAYSCGSQRTVDLLSAITLSIGTWCDFQLSDYHRHFYKSPSNFEKVVASSIIINRLLNSGFDKMEGSGETTKLKESASEKVKMYIMTSTKAAFEQAVNGLEARSNAAGMHPLALLADDLRSIAGRECKMFSPVLSCWYLEAKEKFALLVHEFYGEKLKPFLEGLSQLSSDARSVLISAYLLENDLAQFGYNGDIVLTGSLVKEWHPYEVAATAYPLIQDWVDMQSHNILEWTERAFHLEVWEPVSSLQKHGSSIVEVFRIIEETVDQFFSLRLPVGVKHTRCLLSGIAQCLEGYIEKMRAQLVDKNSLYPAMPALTRYEEGTVNPFIKKKFVECKILDENVLMQLNDLTVFKLCVQANTVHYIGNQVRELEDTIQNHWVNVRTCDYAGKSSDKDLLSHGKLIQELLDPFVRVKKIANDTTNQICDFVGAKVVFWDLKEPFLFNLYRGNVDNARMESALERLDTVLGNVCGLISDALRDVIVHYIFRSSLDGYIWLLLDGGPSRVFTGNDVLMLQEDLNLLKELFIADGEGLPRALVEKEALMTQEILDLYTLHRP
ncbi:protein unc-13 homolog isoform X2 [Nymphaea colorata]|uniref:protein unc-13 homolog isoform X2 n=1 Tax=Nymphaea colorata TaxID=210225 RepID=UPI00129EE8E0|nr:protein unc-13 homolog isoform X2 [Nymphaea colorata]